MANSTTGLLEQYQKPKEEEQEKPNGWVNPYETLSAKLNEKTYVPGLGMIGPDLGGDVKGVQEAINQKLDLDANARANAYLDKAMRELSITEKRFEWEGEDREKEQFIEKGMAAAAKAGGYEGVIEFLKETDPARAIAFHAEKLKLDDMIRTNETMKAIAPAEKTKAMLESYSVLGNISAGILQAEPKDQEALYQQAAPMFKAVLGEGNVPGSFDAAKPLITLAIAQADPKSQALSLNRGIIEAESEIGKLNNDINKLRQQGVSDDDPAIQALQKELNAREMERHQKFLEISQRKTKDMLKTSKDKVQVQRQLAGDIRKDAKDAIDKLNIIQYAAPLVKILEQGPDTPGYELAQAQLWRMVARFTDKGVLSDFDLETQVVASGYEKVYKNVRSLIEGKRVTLNAEEIKQFTAIVKAAHKQQLNSLQNIEKHYKDMIAENEDIANFVDPDSLVMPSKSYENIFSKTKPQVSEWALEAVKRDSNYLPAFIKQYGEDVAKEYGLI